MTRIGKGCLLLVLGLTSSPLAAQDTAEAPLLPERPKEWSRAIRGFRREHNFSVNYGIVSSDWRVHFTEPAEVYQFKTTDHQLRLAYSFHLPIWGALGYELGMRASALIPAASSKARGSEVSYGLPGLKTGLIWNASDHFRLGAGIELGWQRIDQLRTPSENKIKLAGITGETRSYQVVADYFYELSWAVQIEYEMTSFSYQSETRLALSKISKTVCLGFLKHLI